MPIAFIKIGSTMSTTSLHLYCHINSDRGEEEEKSAGLQNGSIIFPLILPDMARPSNQPTQLLDCSPLSTTTLRQAHLKLCNTGLPEGPLGASLQEGLGDPLTRLFASAPPGPQVLGDGMVRLGREKEEYIVYVDLDGGGSTCSNFSEIILVCLHVDSFGELWARDSSVGMSEGRGETWLLVFPSSTSPCTSFFARSSQPTSGYFV